jgi:hypothetical protein
MMALGRDLTVLKSAINVNTFRQTLLKRSQILGYKLFIQGYVHNVSLNEADGKEAAIAAKCYQSTRKYDMLLKLKLMVEDDCSQIIYSL